MTVGLFVSQDGPLAAEKDGDRSNHRLTQAAQGVNRTLVNVGSVAMWIYSTSEASITPGGDGGFFFPRGNTPSTSAIFMDGIVYGGFVNDGASPTLRVGGVQYSVGFAPGRIVSQGVAEFEDRIWRIRRDYRTADLAQDAAEVSQVTSASAAQIADIRAQYEQD